MKYLLSLLLCISSAAFGAGSTINAAVPATNSALQSAPIRANFQAAQNDINNLIEQNFGTAPPASPLLGQLWMNTTTTPYALEVFDGTQWVEYASLNATAHAYQNFSVPWSGVTGTPTTLAGYGITNAVSSVALSMPSIFNVTGSPVTGTGTFVATLASQAPSLFLASPSGSTGVPTMRAITSADLPAGSGTVTSVGLSMPSTFTVTGSPVTGSGTLTTAYASETANTFLAAPNGSAGTPTFRGIAAADVTAVNTLIYNTSSTAPASTAFVQAVVEASESSVTLNLGSTGGGTYSFDGTGTGLRVTYNTSGGAISSILTIAFGGSGYNVGDLVNIIGPTGNNDAIVWVTGASSGSVTSVQILYGGTGYTGIGTGGNSANYNAFLLYSLTLTGTLTSNATFILGYGTYLTASSHGVINNNTTGSFTTTLYQGNGSDGTTGTGLVIPQGANNNASVLIQQDGVTGVWQVAPSLNGSIVNFPSLGATTPGTGAFTTLSASSTVSGTGFSNYLASPPPIGGTTAGAGHFSTLSATGGVTFSGLATSGTITGAACFTSAGVMINEGSSNCFSGSGSASALAAGATVAGSSSLPGMVVTNALEAADVVSSAPASTTNFYFASGAVQYYTTNAANNFILNFAWSSGTTFNSATSSPGVGATATGVLLVTQGTTAYYATSIEVDGTTTGVTTKWQGGSAPSAGNASGIDAYTCSIIKTATTPTYTALCALTQF